MTITLHHATLYHGDCLEQMRTLDAESVDAIVTDPPYGLSFMNRHWDYDVPSVEVWREALRVLKPGGHLLSFSSARTYHRMVVAIEDAGFEVRDQLMWVYGSGFPKSLDISKALDRMAGAEREVVGPRIRLGDVKSYAHNETGGNCYGAPNGETYRPEITAPATEAAQRWAGWGTALKPAHEPICLARKPLIGTVAENVMAHGTGSLNIDASRIPTEENLNGGAYAKNGSDRTDEWGAHNGFRRNQQLEYVQPQGRWPANLIHDGSDQVVGLFPETKSGKDRNPAKTSSSGFTGNGIRTAEVNYGDTGSAARFFYTAKAHASDRDEGLAGFDARLAGCMNMRNDAHAQRTGNTFSPKRNHHPTVKPTDLMRYLCRLITPPGGLILDPYMGSGSTGKGAVLEGFRFVGIEREADYLEIAAARIRHAQQQPDLFHEAVA